jgi:NADH:quinone reductase (non-electrogenic)
VPGHPEIFVVGDTATLDQDGKPLGGVAQVAIQQGRYAGRAIERRVNGKSAPVPFRYFDKGTMAVVGQGYAVLQTSKLRLKALAAWMVWAAVHILFLAQPGLRLSVFLQWMWTFLTGQRGSRLIVKYHGTEREKATAGTPLGRVVSGK